MSRNEWRVIPGRYNRGLWNRFNYWIVWRTFGVTFRDK